MAFWNTDNPDKPIGTHDPDAILDYPVDFSDWLGDDVYASHTVMTTEGLTVQSSDFAGGVVTVWLTGGTLGRKASFTVRMVTAAGRRDDRTLWLKIKDR